MYNIDDFQQRQRSFEKNQEELFQKILDKCMFQMKLALEKKFSSLIFSIPSYIFGLPRIHYQPAMDFLLFRLKQQGFYVEQMSDNELFIDWCKIYNEPDYLKEKPIISSTNSLQNIPIPKMIDNIFIPSSLQLPKTNYINTNANMNHYSETQKNYETSKFHEISKIHEPSLHMPVKEPLFIIRRESKRDDNSFQNQHNSYEKKDSIILGIQDSKPSKQKSNYTSNLNYEKQNYSFEKNKDFSEKKNRNQEEYSNHKIPEKNQKTKIILKTNKNKKEMNKNLPSFLS